MFISNSDISIVERGTGVVIHTLALQPPNVFTTIISGTVQM